MDVIDRLPKLGARAVDFKQAIHNKLIDHKEYICQDGDDLPEIAGWRWGQAKTGVSSSVRDTGGETTCEQGWGGGAGWCCSALPSPITAWKWPFKERETNDEHGRANA